MKKVVTILTVCTLCLGLFSCRTAKQVVYFQDLSKDTTFCFEDTTLLRFKPYDQLQIHVFSMHQELADAFNLQSKGTENQTNRTNYYTVNAEGCIRFPALGKIQVAGKTREELALYIEQELQRNLLLNDAIVKVTYQNLCFSVLGEVGHAGRYEILTDRPTILDALAMIGDLPISARRDNILIIRERQSQSASGQFQTERQTYSINLDSAQSIYTSPAFYLEQNDIIYVEPLPKRQRESTVIGNSIVTPAFWISIGSFAMTISTFITALITK